MGRMRTEKPSERKRQANQVNARKPRGRWAGTPERELLEESKRLLREALPEGARYLAELICDETAPAELRLQAFKIAADRAGLPVQSRQDVALETGRPKVKIFVEECAKCGNTDNVFGWPKMDPNGTTLPAIREGADG